jgi:hypothetical protein
MIKLFLMGASDTMACWDVRNIRFWKIEEKEFSYLPMFWKVEEKT